MVSYHLVASLAYPTKITRDVVQRFVLAACAYILNKKRYLVFANSQTEQTYKVVMYPLARWQSYARAGIRHPRAHILNSGM